MAPKRSPHLDSVDLDQIEHMLGTRAWQLYLQRLQRTISGKMEQLTRDSEEIKTARLRGEIEGLRIALSIPVILLKENRSRKSEE